jgi:Succinylglutamate desuccinylase / Aspartoacylase family
MLKYTGYVIGTPGVAWGDAERAAWLSRQVVQRSYVVDVVSRIERLASDFEVFEYDRLAYEPRDYALFAIKTRDWVDGLPCALVTGGVHGYETSGVHGALEFVERCVAPYAGRVNLMVVPCVSPWAYETVNRWNPYAVDPNRSFRDESAAQEAEALKRLIRPIRDRVGLHIDLHETTDSDESEFRPALAARDGVKYVPGEIPDGFYLVDDSENPNAAFQLAVIAAVARVTHIAAANERGEIIGSRVVAAGVIQYPLKQLGLCAGMTNARCKTTTEVYPDSSRATPEQCNAAQVAAVCAGLDFVLASAIDG